MGDEGRAERIDDEGATLILDRAAQLDAGRGRWVDLRELREAAVEAGISEAAFERALAEVEVLRSHADASGSGERMPSQDTGSHREGWRGRVVSWGRPTALLALGLVLGLLAVFLDEGVGLHGGGAVFTAVLALQIVLYLVVRHRSDRSILGFEMDLAALWAGLTFMLMLGDPRHADEIAGVMSVVWGVAGTVGAGLVALPRRWRRQVGDLVPWLTDPGTSPSSSPSAPSR